MNQGAIIAPMQLAPAPSLSGTVHQIADGVAGVDQTVRVMRELVNRCKSDLRIREAATSVIFIQPEKIAHYEIEALFNFVRDSIRYVRDIHGVETLMAPPTVLAARLGDCDDQACLLACMLESVGYPTRFVVAGYDSGAFEHVYLQVWDGEQWIDLDPTEPQAMGWAPPDPSVIAFEAV